jgi:hypothetical protein
MEQIFISYRRGEDTPWARLISSELARRFGESGIFRDTESIKPVEDFTQAIDEALASCKVMLVLIGPHWLRPGKNGGLRLNDPRDFVRIEIAAALDKGHVVVPVLVNGAAMPSEEKLPDCLGKLARIQAVELTDTHWAYDMGVLVGILEQALGVEAHDPVPAAGPSPVGARTPFSIKAATGISLLAFCLLAYATMDMGRADVGQLRGVLAVSLAALGFSLWGVLDCRKGLARGLTAAVASTAISVLVVVASLNYWLRGRPYAAGGASGGVSPSAPLSGGPFPSPAWLGQSDFLVVVLAVALLQIGFAVAQCQDWELVRSKGVGARVAGAMAALVLGWGVYSLPWVLLAFGAQFQASMVLSPIFFVLGGFCVLGAFSTRLPAVGGFLGGSVPLGALALFYGAINPQFRQVAPPLAWFAMFSVFGGLLGALVGPVVVGILRVLRI